MRWASYASGQRRRLYEFRLCGLGHLACGLPVPGQQFFDAFGGMIGNAGEDIGEPGAGVDIVEFAGLGERVDRGCTSSAAVGA